MSGNVVRLRVGGSGYDAPVEPPDDGGGGGGDASGVTPPQFGAVIPLGVCTLRGSTAYAFLDAAGLRSTLTAAQLRQASWLSGLFGGDAGRDTLERLWPRWEVERGGDGKPLRDSNGKPKLVSASGFNAAAAGDALIAACTRIGHAAAVEMRRDGVWALADGTLLVHCGRRLFARDAEHRPGFRDGHAIYVSAEERAVPAAVSAGVAEGREIEAMFRLWQFAAPGVAPWLLTGMVACGIYGAALPWRPHMFARMREGSGKSSLNRLMAALCGASEPSTDTTEPALRRLADGRSGLIPLDEKEANASGIARIIDLMRGSSDGRGAVVMRASDGGGTDVFRIAGCFFMTAITQPKLTAADVSRITMIELRPLLADRSAEVRAATERAGVLYPAVVTRLVLGWDRYLANLRAARAAVLASDATSRCADQLGALLAGWQVMVSDDVLTEGDAAHLVEPLVEFLTTRADADEIGTPQRVLQHLLPSRVPVGARAGDLMTVQNALQASMAAQARADHAARVAPHDPATAMNAADAEKWRRRLGALGLRFVLGAERDAWLGRGPPAPGLWVRNAAPAIEACFAGTEWAGHAWEGPLRDLPGAQVSRGPVSFAGGGKSRAVFVPAELLGLEDSADADLG